MPSYPGSLVSIRSGSTRSVLLISAILSIPATWPALSAEEATSNGSTNVVAVKAEKGPPLPLHQIEGNGGIFSTLSAYLVNPPRNGEWLGRPSLGFSYVNLGQGRNLEAFTLTETPWKRLELGYGFDRFDLGDLPQAIEQATTVRIRNDDVHLHNLNARLQLVKEGDFEQKWVPAVTFGTHYKLNNGIDDINQDLGGALRNIGIKRNDGVDFTLYASKLLTFLPRPVLLNLGGRATEGAHIGLLGFTEDYSVNFEGNVVVFLTDRLALAAEYRQKPNDYQRIGDLIKPESDWYTIDAAYVVNSHVTLAVGYGHFGGVLNHEANGVWGITTKYEF